MWTVRWHESTIGVRKVQLTASWADLNERQQRYLQAIYEADQELEPYKQGTWLRGGRSRPVIESLNQCGV
jgi:hypothetical protein